MWTHLYKSGQKHPALKLMFENVVGVGQAAALVRIEPESRQPSLTRVRQFSMQPWGNWPVYCTFRE
jgi:hypothetical protein